MPLLGPTMQDRNQVFQRLKSPCVGLSQAALALNGPAPDIKAVTNRLEDLRRELATVTKAAYSLDSKLADYVFFPLSQVLKASQKTSIRCLELTFQCLSVLIEKGWRSYIQAQLAAQVVILCTLMSEKQPKGLASADSTDDLRASALLCLFHLFDVLDPGSETRDAMTSEANFPQMGQTISTILDAILDGVSAEVQLAATKALVSLFKNAATRDIKAGFLPGVVSKLTKVLTPQTNKRRQSSVLIGALDVLQSLFIDTLNEPASEPTPTAHKQMTKGVSIIIDAKWLENAASQLKPAIASIVKLRDHSRSDVHEALARFCFVVLKQCRKSLPNCGPLALETLLLLSSKQTGDAIRFRLESLAHEDRSISNLIQSNLFDWLQSVPTQMQGADDQAKVQRLQQIATAYDVSFSSGADTTALDRLLASVLRDSVLVTIQPPKMTKQSSVAVSPIQTLDITLLEGDRSRKEFSSALVKHRGQQEVLEAVEQLTTTIASAPRSANAFAADLARSLRQSHDDAQLATFWLLLNIVEFSIDRNKHVDQYLVVADERSASYQDYREYLEDIYAFALDILTDTPNESLDPRLQALALRTLALRARTIGEGYQLDLMDTLYPVLHTLATPIGDLQRDSIATLNIVTEACGYSSVKDLIVENVDYLTNSVALKLNAFDVSPQAPQVLLMMVRLAGPSLLPYLEDTIDSIFAALRDYHGYPLLVELLFKVLAVVAEEGSKAPQLALTDDQTKQSAKKIKNLWRSTSIPALVELLAERRDEELKSRSHYRPEFHPKRPWTDEITAAEDDPEEPSEIDEPSALEVESSPPAPKVYGLLLKICELTQHFLPSASASLRLSLLSLIKTATPAIARHENSFLPLINTLWPEITSRLDDAEPSVVASALDIIALLYQYAGDFMRSRAMQLWPGLIGIYERTAKDVVQGALPATASRTSVKGEDSKDIVLAGAHLKQAISRMQATPADYSDTSTRLIWTSLVHAITAAVQYTDLSPDHFDEAMDMLDPMLEQPEVRAAFECENPDAVWLARVRTGSLTFPDIPKTATKEDWNFAIAVG